MSFDPLTWLPIADRLRSDGDEAARRTAVGRYCYAVFIQARRSLEHDGLYNASRSRADHAGVVWALRRNRRGRAADFLARLGTLRNTADYDAAIPLTAVHSDDAWTLALEIQRLLRDDWARLEDA